MSFPPPSIIENVKNIDLKEDANFLPQYVIVPSIYNLKDCQTISDWILRSEHSFRKPMRVVFR